MSYSGRLVETASLTAINGETLPVQVLQLDKDLNNISNLRDMAGLWHEEALRWKRLRLSKEQVGRAQFSSDTAFIAGKALMMNPSDERVYALVGQDQLLGLAVVRMWSPREAYISLQTTAPEHQPSSPNEGKIRGIGTTLLHAIGSDFRREGVTRVTLRPLDDKAAAFWSARGFVPFDHSMELRDERVKCLVEHCSPDWPDAPDAGEFTGIGDYQDPGVLAVTLPV